MMQKGKNNWLGKLMMGGGNAGGARDAITMGVAKQKELDALTRGYFEDKDRPRLEAATREIIRARKYGLAKRESAVLAVFAASKSIKGKGMRDWSMASAQIIVPGEMGEAFNKGGKWNKNNKDEDE